MLFTIRTESVRGLISNRWIVEVEGDNGSSTFNNICCSSELNAPTFLPTEATSGPDSAFMYRICSGMKRSEKILRYDDLEGDQQDRLIFCKLTIKLNGSTFKGRVKFSLGGVGRNIFDCLTRLGHKPLFISAVGNDANGEMIIKNNILQDNRGFLKLEQIATSSCSVILDGKGECALLIGDMRSHDYITKEHISQFHNEICSAPLVVMDANIPVDSMIYIFKLCSDYKIPIWYEPTDMNVAHKIFDRITGYHQSLKFASPNFYELESMANFLFKRESKITDNINQLSLELLINKSLEIAKQIMEMYFHTIIVTLGKFGVLVISKAKIDDCIQLGPNSDLFTSYQFPIKTRLDVKHYPQENLENQVINVSGAGDCMASAIISGLLNNKPMSESIVIGLKAAKLSLLSTDTIPRDFGIKIGH